MHMRSLLPATMLALFLTQNFGLLLEYVLNCYLKLNFNRLGFSIIRILLVQHTWSIVIILIVCMLYVRQTVLLGLLAEARSAITCRCCFYSRADFGAFRPAKFVRTTSAI